MYGVAIGLAAVVASGVSAREVSSQPSGKAAEVKPVTLAGCLQRDSQVSSVAAATAVDVTAFRLIGVSADALRSAAAASALDVGGATMVRLQRYCDLDFLDHLGHAVEVRGRLIDAGPDVRRLSVVTALGTIGWTPVIQVESFHAGGACQ